MALILNQDAQLMFFTNVFGAGHDVTVKAKALIAAGVSFETGMLSLKAKYKGAQYSVVLTTGTTALMKNTVDFPVALQNKGLIVDWVNKLYSTIDVSVAAMTPDLAGKIGVTGPKGAQGEPGIPSGDTMVTLTGGDKDHLLALIKAVQVVCGGVSIVSAKKKVEAALAGVPQELAVFATYDEAHKAFLKLEAAYGKASLHSAMAKATAAVKGFSDAVAAKPVDAVLNLKDAKALGQKVHGTSTGSVYRCIAIAEHVKLAAKLGTDGGISIRAEWTDNPQADLAKLTDAGVQLKSGYGSIHFHTAGVPVQRVIGAFLVGAGINWKAAVMNGAELVIGSAS